MAKMNTKRFFCEVKYNSNLLLVIIPLLFVDICHARPHEDCYDHMNTSDCGFPPSPVFYYYHSGSRCEIAIWRGCPTYNMFPDERVCSHFCIGRVIGIMREEVVDKSLTTPGKDVNNKTNEIEDWRESLNQLDTNDTDLMNDILDKMDEDQPAVEKLKFSVPKDEKVEGEKEAGEAEAGPQDQDATTVKADDEGTADTGAPETPEASPDEAKPDEAKEPAAETTTAAAAEETTAAAAAAETTAAPETTAAATTLDPDLGDPDEVISTL